MPPARCCSRGVWACSQPTDPLPGRIERLRERFADFSWHIQTALASVSRDEQVLCNPAEEVNLDHWHHGRVLNIPAFRERGHQLMHDSFAALIPEP
jgi:hypothetical protein